MKINVTIKDKSNGYVGVYCDDWEYTANEDGDEKETVWQHWRDDSNSYCDCNLGNVLYGDSEDRPCGNDRFEILAIHNAYTDALVWTGAELIV